MTYAVHTHSPHCCHSRVGGNPVIPTRKFLDARIEFDNEKGDAFYFCNKAYSRFLCFLCLGSLDSRLRGNDRRRDSGAAERICPPEADPPPAETSTGLLPSSRSFSNGQGET